MEAIFAKRLAFIKYLFGLGVSQSQLPEPSNAAAILMFHDAVELFNHLACEYLDIEAIGDKKRQIDFLQYWDLLFSQKDIRLPQKESMKRLNNARVGLKHHGVLPPTLEIESLRANTSSFFADSFPLVFNLEFKDISLVELVNEEHVREHLKEASKYLVSGDLISSTRETGLAFHILIADYENRKRMEYGPSPFSFGYQFGFFDLHDLDTPPLYTGRDEHGRRDHEFRRALSNFADRVAESINSMQQAIRMLAIGIDYPKYAKFVLFTPTIQTTLDGRHDILERSTLPIPLTPSEAEFCIDFVIETALKLQGFDYSL